MKDYSKNLTENIKNDAMKGKFDNKSGRVFGGIVLLVIGGTLLCKQLGFELPYWLFTWKTFLITLGIYIGARQSFKGTGWIFPVLIGSVFLVQDFYPEVPLQQFIWPVVMIGFGLIMIFRKKRDHSEWSWDTRTSTDDYIDATSIFGGTKRMVISKDFKGADITNVFGGADIDLTQADITGQVVMDITQVFGGTKLLVPAHWTVQSNVVCVFGQVEDKRRQSAVTPDPAKILRLDGTTVFGGIEIKSF